MSLVCQSSPPGPTQVLHSLFENLDIEPHQRAVLQQRYLSVLKNFQTRANRFTILFYTARIVITVGSILIPALLSIEGTVQDSIYWAAWMISLCVTISNGLIALFKIDKKYFFIHTTLELLQSEGWQYVGLSGRYAPKDAPVPPTHENQFLAFSHMAEKIKMRQVEEEYWKFTDTAGVANGTTQKLPGAIQTPVTQQGALALLPHDQKLAIEGWLGAMRRNSISSGLAPRNPNLQSPRVDGTSPPTVRRTSSSFEVPVLSDVPEETSPRPTVLSDTSMRHRAEGPSTTIYENTEIEM